MLHTAQKNNKSTTYKRVSVILFCSMCFIAIVTKNQHFSDAVSYVLYPVIKIQQGVQEWLQARELRAKENAELTSRIQLLQEECDVLREENNMLHATSAHYDDIAEIVSFKERYASSARTLVHIIGRVFTDNDHYVLIDAGKDQNVSRNMVALYHNAIVGVVEEVYPRYAKIRLVTDKRCKISVSCIGTGGTGIHKGKNNNQETEISYMSHLAHVLVGDRVVSSGEGALFPQGFLVGNISAYERDGLYYRITVTPGVDVTAIQYCDLIAPHALTE